MIKFFGSSQKTNHRQIMNWLKVEMKNAQSWAQTSSMYVWKKYLFIYLIAYNSDFMIQFGCLVVICAFKLSIRVNFTKQIWQAKGFCLEWTTKCLLSRELFWKFFKQTSHWKRPDLCTKGSWNRNKFLGSLFASKNSILVFGCHMCLQVVRTSEPHKTNFASKRFLPWVNNKMPFKQETVPKVFQTDFTLKASWATSISILKLWIGLWGIKFAISNTYLDV